MTDNNSSDDDMTILEQIEAEFEQFEEEHTEVSE
jgi:hypothetical protein